MKLIDMLVEELPKRGGWPDGVRYITQDNGYDTYKGTICGYDSLPEFNRKIWLSNKPDRHANVVIMRINNIASDYTAAIITREQYEAALAAKNDGWIEWGGGECPLHHGAIVDVKLRNARTEYAQEALSIEGYASYPFWRKDNASGDIIAYRLHQPQEAVQAKADDENDLNECIGQGAAPVWSGEGLPPVGFECEVSVDGGRSWCTYRAINEKNGARLIEIGNFTEEFQNNNWIFRPIRSEADRKREEAVKTITLTGWCQDFAEEIYDLIAAGKIPGVKLED